MVQPINYILDVKTPFQAAAEGFNLGAAGEAARVQREDRERAIAQQAAAQQQLAELKMGENDIVISEEVVNKLIQDIGKTEDESGIRNIKTIVI